MESHRSQEPSPLLVDHVTHFRRGKALDVATGFGRNALYLAGQGYQVTGLDRDEGATAFCNAEAARRGLSFTASCVDLEKDPPISNDTYELVTCFYYLDRNLLPVMKEAVKVGGVLVYETFLIDQHRKFGKPSRPEFCWGHNELLGHFLDFRVLFYFEGLQAGRWISQLIAERTPSSTGEDDHGRI